MKRDFYIKLFALSSVYVAFIAFTIALLMRVAPFPTIGARRGGLITLILFFVPNVLAFLFTATRLRKHWSRLLGAHLAIASCFASIGTFAVATVMSQLFAPLFKTVSPISWAAFLSMMLLPGIIAAQLLRFRWGTEPPSRTA